MPAHSETVYVCFFCGNVVSYEELRKFECVYGRVRIRCPKCGNQVLVKPRPPRIKRVKAR